MIRHRQQFTRICRGENYNTDTIASALHRTQTQTQTFNTDPVVDRVHSSDPSPASTTDNCGKCNCGEGSLLNVILRRIYQLLQLLVNVVPLNMMKEVGQFFDKNRPPRKDVNLNEVFNNLDDISVLGATPKNQRYKGAFNIFESIAESNPSAKGE